MSAVLLQNTGRRETRLAFAALMGSGVAWGLIWIPLKFFAAAGLNGQVLGLSVYALIGLATLPLIWRERAAWRGELRLLLLIGLFFGWANMAFTSAIMMGSVVRAMLLLSVARVGRDRRRTISARAPSASTAACRSVVAGRCFRDHGRRCDI